MKIPLLSFLFASAFLAAGLLVGDYIKQRNEIAYIYSIEQANSALKHQENSNRSAPIIKGPNAVGQENAEHGRNEEPKWTDIAITAFTFAIAIFTIALFWDGREKGRRELRAYLGIKTAKLRMRRLAEGTKILAEICISNAGQTTANHARLAIHVDIANNTRGEFPVTFREGETYLVHGFEWNAQQATDSFISQELENDLVTRRKFVILWGEITYEDVFGKGRRSTFRFRQGMLNTNIFTVTGPEISGEVVGWDVYPCEEGNEAT